MINRTFRGKKLLKKGVTSLLAMSLCASMVLPVKAAAVDMSAYHLTTEEKAMINKQCNTKKINTILSTDGEHDDMASMIRYLTMANEFNTKAIVLTASAAGHHTGGNITYPNQAAVEKLTDAQKGFIKEQKRNDDGSVTVTYNQNRWTGFRWIHYFIEKYGDVYQNLKVHDSSYPTPAYLDSIVKYGNVKLVGDMQEETEGSEYIKKLILENPDGEPLYIQHWGGTNTTARALKSIEEEYKGTAQWDKIVKKINNEVTLYMIWGTQAPTYGSYIAANWPGIRVIVNQDLFFSFYRTYTMPGRHTEDTKKTWFGKEWGDTILNIGSPLTSEAMMDTAFNLSNEAIQNPENKFYTKPTYDSKHGQYEADNFPFDTWGDSGSNNTLKRGGTVKTDADYSGSFMAEGDTPSYFFLMNNGLRSYEDPSWGGWAGRFGKANKNRPNEYTDVVDETEDHSANPFNGKYTPVVKDAVSAGNTVEPKNWVFSRWVQDFQAEYSAHAKWSVTSRYKYANHHPKAAVMNGLDLKVTAGQTIDLKGVAYDPDGDELTYKWWRYADADTHKDVGTIDLADTKDVKYTIPKDAKVGDTIHLIFEVSDAKDNDTYTSLKNYKRVVLTVGEATRADNTNNNNNKNNNSTKPAQKVNLDKVVIKKAKAAKKKVTLKWKKDKKASGYEIYMSKKKNSGYKKIKTIRTNKKVTYTKTKLKSKKNYFFKIRSYKKIGKNYIFGKLSRVKKVKVR